MPAPVMGGFVVDASVAAAWLLPDEADAGSEALLDATATQTVWVPALWTLEICNLLHSAQRRRRIVEAQRLQLVAAASALRLRVDHEPVTMTALDQLAAAHGLSSYDACYLELAQRLQLPLATRDAALRLACEVSGIAVLG